MFFSKLDMLDRLEQEVAFLFPKKESAPMQKFIHTYTKLLMVLFAYRNNIKVVPLPMDNKERHFDILGLYYALQEYDEEITRNKVEAKMAKSIHL